MRINSLEGLSGNICIYPYSDEILPLLRHVELFSPEWKITSLISPKSWGYDGQQIQCGSNTISVKSSFKNFTETFDYILIPDFLGNYSNPSVIKQILSRIFPILDRLSGIILSTVLNSENYTMLKEACCGVCELIDLNQFSTDNDTKYEYDKRDGLLEIDVPIVGIVGMWEETDKFEVSLSLREKFISNGYRVSQIGSRNYCEILGFHSFPRFMLNPAVGEEDKVYQLNRYVKQLVDEEKPDIILISIPGGTQQLNNKFTNRFGILPFLVSKAVSFDALVFCTLYELNAGKLFEMISTSFQYKYGCKAAAYHMSNTVFDSPTLFEKEIMKLNHLERSEVSTTIKANYSDMSTQMVNVFEEDEAEKLYQTIIHLLTGSVAELIR